MADIGHGDVIKYSYLWAREHLKGEESGRKTRPACVMIVLAGHGGRQNTLIFLITSQRPSPDTPAVEVPDMEARRAQLYQPAWVIISELNSDDLTTSFALEDSRPLGRFSRKFMLKLAVEIRAIAQARKMRIVSRR